MSVTGGQEAALLLLCLPASLIRSLLALLMNSGAVGLPWDCMGGCSGLVIHNSSLLCCVLQFNKIWVS